jgi:hypothetical protein
VAGEGGVPDLQQPGYVVRPGFLDGSDVRAASVTTAIPAGT